MQDDRTRAASQQLVGVTMERRIPHAVEDAVVLAQIAKTPEVASVEEPHEGLSELLIAIDRMAHDDVDLDALPQLNCEPQVVVGHARLLRRPGSDEREPRASNAMPRRTGNRPLVGIDRLLGDTRPRVLGDPAMRPESQPVELLCRAQDLGQAGSDGVGIVRIECSLGVAEHLRHRRCRAPGDRRAARHGLENGQSKSLVEGGEHEQRAGVIQGAEIGVTHVPGQDELVRPDPRPIGSDTEQLGLPRVQNAHDHQLVPRPQGRRQAPEGDDHRLHVLAEVGPSDIEQKARAYGFQVASYMCPCCRGRRVHRGKMLVRAGVDDVDPLGGNLKALDGVVGGVLRQGEDAVDVTDQLHAA